MKTIFLIPPSEGKNTIGEQKESEKLSFVFEKPLEISKNATEKDLKCKDKRFEEAIFLNKNIENSKVLESIKRYTGVMFSAIDYENMTEKGKNFFDENFFILSGMYGILKPKDNIGNYKLPISTKGLYDFWGNKIFEKILELNPENIVNLLPKDYEKVLNLKKNKKILSQKNIKFININFLKSDGKKISHGVKVIKGKFIKEICEKNISDFEKFSLEIKKIDEVFVDVNIFAENG
ncbi:hypothetical protein DLH72_01525 [Candidatus Gracilibacteria bacterium]|nr:MAG: hypothetical protein DLH72_01525 [Candidatus Gracilibacteria bacterium]